MASRLGKILHELSGWMLLATMVVSPWLLGTIPPWAIAGTLWFLLGTFVVWVAGLVLARRSPSMNWPTLIGAALLVQGWMVTWNPVSAYEGDAHGGQFVPVPEKPLFHGTVDAYSSYLGMLSVSVLFLTFHVALEHLETPAFRRRMLWAASAGGASVAALGILQHAHMTEWLLPYMTDTVGKPFGPFNYHVNAGAFLVMGFAASAALAARSFALELRGAGVTSVVFGLLTLAGIGINDSRTSVVVAGLTLAGMAVGAWMVLKRVLPGVRRNWPLVAIVIVVGTVTIAGLSFVLMSDKWLLLFDQLGSNNPRVILWRITLRMMKDAGALGMGPNTFSVALPLSPRMDAALYGNWIVTWHKPGEAMSAWTHAHNDLLQAFVEWGAVGGLMWWLASILTVFAGWKGITDRGCPAEMRLIFLGGYAALASLFVHSLVDFPLQILALQLYGVCFAAMAWASVGAWRVAMPARRYQRVRVMEAP